MHVIEMKYIYVLLVIQGLNITTNSCVSFQIFAKICPDPLTYYWSLIENTVIRKSLLRLSESNIGH